MAEAGLQHAVEVADGDACVRHLHLDVAGPGIGELARARAPPGGGLQPGQHVEHPAGHHPAGEAARGERRRRAEGFHHHRAGVEGVEDHDHQADGDGGDDEPPEHLERVAQLQAEAAQLALQRLGLQLAKAKRALLVQLRGLDVDQDGLFLEEPLGRAGDGGIVFGVISRHGRGEGVGADARLRWAGFRALRLAPRHAAKQLFGHDATPALASPRSFLPAAAIRTTEVFHRSGVRSKD